MYSEVGKAETQVLLIQFLLGVHFERLISLLLLFDARQVVLCTPLQHVLVLDGDVEDNVIATCRERSVLIT